MRGIHLDPDAPLIKECYAVVYVPRQSRDRFPESSVTLVESEQAARDQANPAKKRYAAKVIGPSRSSEGLHIYYVTDWLDQAE